MTEWRRIRPANLHWESAIEEGNLVGPVTRQIKYYVTRYTVQSEVQFDQDVVYRHLCIELACLILQCEQIDLAIE